MFINVLFVMPVNENTLIRIVIAYISRQNRWTFSVLCVTIVTRITIAFLCFQTEQLVFLSVVFVMIVIEILWFSSLLSSLENGDQE